MNKITKRFSIALTAAAGLACAAPAAFAAGPPTITAGPIPAEDIIPFHAATAGTTPQIHFNDTTSNVGFTCDSGTATGTLTTGPGSPGIDALTINGPSTTWANCQGAGLAFTLTGSGNWQFNAASGGPGNLTGVDFTATGTNSFGTTCDFTVTGSVPATYDGTTSTFNINGGGLTASAVGGTCGSLGVIKNGDAMTFQLGYVITPDNPLTSLTVKQFG